VRGRSLNLIITFVGLIALSCVYGLIFGHVSDGQTQTILGTSLGTALGALAGVIVGGRVR